MTASEIIEKFLNYAEYDENERTFNLLSAHYDLHRMCDEVRNMIEFDPKCEFAVLYIRDQFEDLLKRVSLKAWDLVNETVSIDTEKEIWTMLNSTDVQEIESSILDGVSNLVQSATGKLQIGERNPEAERNSLSKSVISVIQELKKCRVELFLRGGQLQPVTSINRNLQVFNTIAECLCALEKAPDAMYVCFITQNGTSDGFFGFFWKNNGNILSINEKINEAYPWQHACLRNGRWMEGKASGIFPYDMISGEDFDYKGYARKLKLDDSNRQLFTMSKDSYLPLIIAVIMINNKFAYRDTDRFPDMYVDTLLSKNLEIAAGRSKALIPIVKSLVAKANAQYQIPFTSNDIISGTPAEQFVYNPNNWSRPSGSFLQEKNIFAELYGDGFRLDKSKILHTDSLLLPPGRMNDDAYTPEFIATKDGMDLIAYYQGREQLANYIRDRMLDEYLNYGGAQAVNKWWETAITARRDLIIEMCVRKWKGVQDGTMINPSSLNAYITKEEPLRYIYIANCKSGKKESGYYCFNAYHPFGKVDLDGTLYCSETGAKASMCFIFNPRNWREIAEIVGTEDIPKCLKGYEREGHSGIGNSLLETTDAVAEIGTVFESREQRVNHRLWRDIEWDYNRWRNSPTDAVQEFSVKIDSANHPSMCDFTFDVSFSKRGWNKVIEKCQLPHS